MFCDIHWFKQGENSKHANREQRHAETLGHLGSETERH